MLTLNCTLTVPIMCKELISSTKFLCQHVLDQPSTLIEWEDCGSCGEKKAGPEYLGQTTKREPCEDCKENGAYVKDESGKWVEA